MTSDLSMRDRRADIGEAGPRSMVEALRQAVETGGAMTSVDIADTGLRGMVEVRQAVAP